MPDGAARALITAPGAYDGIPSEAYHSPGLTPEPALSSSGAKLLLPDSCPAIYKHEVLDGNRKQKREFDIGSAGHVLTLEPHRFNAAVSVIDTENYLTKAAREARAAAYASGKIPLLLQEHARVQGMRASIRAHIAGRLAFHNGVAERTYVWRDPETGILCKCRPDYEPPGDEYLIDLKTCVSAADADLNKRLSDHGWHLSATWYLDGKEAVTGRRPKRFYIVAVEKEPPYLVNVRAIDAEAMEWGALLARKARRIFADCLRTGVWPGYPVKGEPLRLTKFAAEQLQRRHEAGEFNFDTAAEAAE